jgi:hypothetical protein
MCRILALVTGHGEVPKGPSVTHDRVVFFGLCTHYYLIFALVAYCHY